MENSLTSDEQNIANDVVRTLVLYALAEFQSGHAKVICVDAGETSFSVADDGRGHAIERTISGSPYLKFVYQHFDYPFGLGQGAPVQLQGIGMSLINTLCQELTVTARKRDVALRMSFLGGSLCSNELFDVTSEETGNTISGTIKSQIHKTVVNAEKLQQWLLEILAASPSLRLFFNGVELSVHPKIDT